MQPERAQSKDQGASLDSEILREVVNPTTPVGELALRTLTDIVNALPGVANGHPPPMPPPARRKDGGTDKKRGDVSTDAKETDDKEEKKLQGTTRVPWMGWVGYRADTSIPKVSHKMVAGAL